MHARKSKPALTVKGNDFGSFSVPRINVKDQMDMVPYAFAVGSSMNAQVWYYPKSSSYIRVVFGNVQSRYRSLEWS